MSNIECLRGLTIALENLPSNFCKNNIVSEITTLVEVMSFEEVVESIKDGILSLAIHSCLREKENFKTIPYTELDTLIELTGDLKLSVVIVNNSKLIHTCFVNISEVLKVTFQELDSSLEEQEENLDDLNSELQTKVKEILKNKVDISLPSYTFGLGGSGRPIDTTEAKGYAFLRHICRRSISSIASESNRSCASVEKHLGRICGTFDLWNDVFIKECINLNFSKEEEELVTV